MRDKEPRDGNGQCTLSHWSRPPQTVKVRRFLLQNCLSSVPVNICLFASLTILPLVWSFTEARLLVSFGLDVNRNIAFIPLAAAYFLVVGIAFMTLISAFHQNSYIRSFSQMIKYANKYIIFSYVFGMGYASFHALVPYFETFTALVTILLAVGYFFTICIAAGVAEGMG